MSTIHMGNYLKGHFPCASGGHRKQTGFLECVFKTLIRCSRTPLL
uniref:Uncharacterized protein n=1 Tax=Anguilla anguilla TaxID=7936 RepID=A0A0E9TKA0_ANGAN